MLNGAGAVQAIIVRIAPEDKSTKPYKTSGWHYGIFITIYMEDSQVTLKKTKNFWTNLFRIFRHSSAVTFTFR